MKVVILCGGQGMRMREHTDVMPKPMVEIGGMPILWHIMKTYAHYGFQEFVLCLGYRGEVIKSFFYNYEMLVNDFTVELGTRNTQIHPGHQENGWKVTLADTGQEAMTGARVKRVERYIDGDSFFLTYGDGVTDLRIDELLAFHKSHGRMATITGVHPPSHYGVLDIQGDSVRTFQEKPKTQTTAISGGYFVFQRELLDHLRPDDGCILEREPLEELARAGELKVFHHAGFWQCMDTHRDWVYLNDLWSRGKSPWVLW